MLMPAIHFGFGLMTMLLFCAAVAVAANRAPRHLLWLGLVAAGNICATAASGTYLIFMAQMMKGNRSISDSNGILVVQSIFGGIGNLLILASAF